MELPLIFKYAKRLVFIRFFGLPYAEYAKHFIEIYSIRIYRGESVKEKYMTMIFMVS